MARRVGRICWQGISNWSCCESAAILIVEELLQLFAMFTDKAIVIRNSCAVCALFVMFAGVSFPVSHAIPASHIVLSQGVSIGEHITYGTLLLGNVDHYDLVVVSRVSFDEDTAAIDASGRIFASCPTGVGYVFF